MSDDKPIMLPELCLEHQKTLVQKCEVPETGPWRSLLVVANVVLFQAATADDKIHKEIEGEISRIGEIGCLACRKQSQFWDIIDVYKLNKLSGVKALGDKWIAEGSKPKPGETQ